MAQSAQAPPAQVKIPTSLRTFIMLVLIVAIVLLCILAGILSYFFAASPIVFVMILLIFGIIFGVVGCLIIWRKLAPLNDLYLGSLYLAHGELAHRINIPQHDEIGAVAESLNQMSTNLANMVSKVSFEKDVYSLQKNKLNIVLNALTDGIIVLNINRQVVYINPTAEKMTGWHSNEVQSYPIEQIMKISDSIGQEIPPLDYAPVTSDETPEAKSFTEKPLLIIGKAGQRAYITLTSAPVNSSLNTDLGRILILRSVDRQKQLESMQLDFVSMASHELRTPLTSIKGYLSVFINENRPKLSREQNDFLERIMISAQQLSALVENLLSVSKVERGAFSINAQTVDWNKMLDQAVRDGQPAAIQKNIRLSLVVPPSPLPQVSADTVRIVEVINNLISNAINYTPEGGKIVVSAKVMGNEVVTGVADNGRGIPKDALAHLFTKFFRIQGALDKASNSKGTGLGLFLSKSIVDLHHGKIWAESPGPNMGTTFFFTLPISHQKTLQESLTSLDVPALKV